MFVCLFVSFFFGGGGGLVGLFFVVFATFLTILVCFLVRSLTLAKSISSLGLSYFEFIKSYLDLSLICQFLTSSIMQRTNWNHAVE